MVVRKAMRSASMPVSSRSSRRRNPAGPRPGRACPRESPPSRGPAPCGTGAPGRCARRRSGPRWPRRRGGAPRRARPRARRAAARAGGPRQRCGPPDRVLGQHALAQGRVARVVVAQHEAATQGLAREWSCHPRGPRQGEGLARLGMSSMASSSSARHGVVDRVVRLEREARPESSLTVCTPSAPP